MARRAETSKESGGVQSVERALSILELLCKSQSPLGASEISEKLNINRTTVYGLINSLIKKDYVVVSEVNGKFTITGKMYGLSYLYPNRLPVVRCASSYMLELAEKFNTTIHLGTLSIRNDVLLVKAQFPKNIQNVHSGSHFPLHATGLGKVLMAFLPEEKKNTVIEECNLKQLTSRTITDREVLRKELEEIVERGYGRDLEEYLEGTSCAAFPIFNERHEIVAAMSVSGATDIIEGQISQIISEGLRCSKQCSSEMGWSLYN